MYYSAVSRAVRWVGAGGVLASPRAQQAPPESVLLQAINPVFGPNPLKRVSTNFMASDAEDRRRNFVKKAAGHGDEPLVVRFGRLSQAPD